MPLIQDQVSVPANGSIANVLAGSQYEFLPYDALVEFGMNASAIGLFVDVYSGADALAEAVQASSANRVPLYPDDFALKDVAAAGERLKLRARNSTGAAITLFFAARIEPV